jgi:hypothetical protein
MGVVNDTSDHATSPSEPEGAESLAQSNRVAQVIGALGLLVLGVGTIVYRILEDWSWVDSLYFSTVTLTTVGFGDLAPSTDASKLFTVFYIFSGISLIGAMVNEFSKRHGRRARRRVERHR